MSDQAIRTHLCGWMVLRRSDGAVLLARRSGVTYGEGLWGLPGGHAERTESWAAAAVRETLEEVGVTVDPADLERLGVQRYVDGALHGVDAFFASTRWHGEPSPVSECSEVGWFQPDALPADALPWLARSLDLHLLRRVWLDELLDG
ncbi:MAG TPA: NUDIX domain-containing protein [Actinomycetales bacterium]|jgi:8-oxo-dGTP diphosphatase